MSEPPYRRIYQLVKSEYDWVYLTKKLDRNNAKVVQIIRRGKENPTASTWGSKPLEKQYVLGETIGLTDKGKYRRMKILATGSWEQVSEVAVWEAL